MKKIFILFMMMGIPFFMSAQCVVNFNTVVDANLLIIKWECSDTTAIFTGQISECENCPFKKASNSKQEKEFIAIYLEPQHFWFRVRYTIKDKYYYSEILEIVVPLSAFQN